MSGSTTSAAYFGKTSGADEFLKEFIRFRRAVLESSSPQDDSDHSLPDPDAPYRRSKFSDDSKSPDEVTQICESDDNLLNVAVQMTLDTDLHLDAFISLVDAYDVMCRDFPDFEHLNFELYEILRDAKITGRKFPHIAERVDIEWCKKLAHEIKYKRQTEDIRELMVPSDSKISEFRPPIISGLNIIFGVALTFIGAFSISGSLGLKDPLYRSLIGIGFSFLALVVDTVLYLIRQRSIPP